MEQLPGQVDQIVFEMERENRCRGRGKLIFGLRRDQQIKKNLPGLFEAGTHFRPRPNGSIRALKDNEDFGGRFLDLFPGGPMDLVGTKRSLVAFEETDFKALLPAAKVKSDPCVGHGESAQVKAADAWVVL